MTKTIIMWMTHLLLGHVGNKADNTVGGFLNSPVPQRQPMVTRTRLRQWDVIETNVNERLRDTSVAMDVSLGNRGSVPIVIWMQAVVTYLMQPCKYP